MKLIQGQSEHLELVQARSQNKAGEKNLSVLRGLVGRVNVKASWQNKRQF